MASTGTIAQLWQQRCREGGDHPALRYKRGGLWSTLTWREFFERGRAIGLAMADEGFGRGDVVSIVSDNRPEWLIVDMAAQALGCISHGVYPGNSAGRVAQALEMAGSRIVFVENAEQLAKLLAAGENCARVRRIVVMQPEGLRHVEDRRVARFADWLTRGEELARQRPGTFDETIDAGTADAILLLASTAGTTGPPRLAAIDHARYLQRLHAARIWLPLETGDRLLSFVPLSQVSERLLVQSALLMNGGLLHFPESIATVVNDLAEVAPRLLAAPSRFWERLHARTDLFMRHDAAPLARAAYVRSLTAAPRRPWHRLLLKRVRASLGLQNMRMALVSGEQPTPDLAAWYEALDVPLFTGYTVAEMAGYCSIAPLTTAGTASDVGLELELDVSGEILVKGMGRDLAYWTRGTLHPAPSCSRGSFRTGDIGTRSAGNIRVVGRMPLHAEGAEQPLPERVELALRTSPYIADAIVIMAGQQVARCLLMLEEERVRRYAQDRDLTFSDYASLASNPDVVELLAEQVDQVNRSLDDGLRVKRFDIIARPLHPDDDELTPSLRLNRRVVQQNYSSLLGTRP